MNAMLRISLTLVVAVPFVATAFGAGYDPNQKWTYANSPLNQRSSSTRSYYTQPQVESRRAYSYESAPSLKAGDMVELNASDRAAAEKQKVCPVSDAPLGSMGTPVKVKVKDRTLFLCCAGCKGKLIKNPEKYLEKLDKQNKK